MPTLRHKVTSWIWVLHSLKPLRIIFPDDNRMELKKKHPGKSEGSEGPFIAQAVTEEDQTIREGRRGTRYPFLNFLGKSEDACRRKAHATEAAPTGSASHLCWEQSWAAGPRLLAGRWAGAPVNRAQAGGASWPEATVDTEGEERGTGEQLAHSPSRFLFLRGVLTADVAKYHLILQNR